MEGKSTPSYANVTQRTTEKTDSSPFGGVSSTPLKPPLHGPSYEAPPIEWDFQERYFTGIVASKSLRTTPRYVRIFNPLCGCSHYSYSKTALELPLGTMVSFQQGKHVSISRSYRRGAKNVHPITADWLERDNKDSEHQLWGEGFIHSYSKMQGSGTLHFTGGFDRPARVNFSPGELLPGSHLPPVGSPVRFQTSYIPPQNKNDKGKIRVSNIFYDPGRELKHTGIVPSDSAIAEIRADCGEDVNLLLGVPSDYDPRGVSISELLEQGVDLLTRPALADILAASLKVLELRLDALELEPAIERDAFTNADVERLSKAVPRIASGNASVLCLGSAIKPSTWANVINNGLARADSKNQVLGTISVAQTVNSSLCKENVLRESGYITRNVEQWKTPDHLGGLTLFYDPGPAYGLDIDGVGSIGPIPGTEGLKTLVATYYANIHSLEDSDVLRLSVPIHHEVSGVQHIIGSYPR